MTTKITVNTTVIASIENVWKAWTTPNDILQWNHASDDWHTTKVENNLEAGGTFSFRMEAKDGSFGFDFNGIYDCIKINELIEYTMADGRTSIITFSTHDNEVFISQTFDAETQNTIELQQFGWQSIMNNFKKYIDNENN
ncbi:MAG: SRPBCC domain-containing protein [Saprospiraceae bacterium]|nr:SRPBCC domain-containing protein [Saprospiraceae bacterium]MBK9728218.1 SRPBCC domain-containing protein [Saprospiraceae bacterium]